MATAALRNAFDQPTQEAQWRRLIDASDGRADRLARLIREAQDHVLAFSPPC